MADIANKIHQTGDRDLQKSQENVRAAFLQLASLYPRLGAVVQRVSVGATATVINHKVNVGAARNPQGWSITDIDTNATVKRTAWDATTITLVASAACAVQLEVW